MAKETAPAKDKPKTPAEKPLAEEKAAKGAPEAAVLQPSKTAVITSKALIILVAVMLIEGVALFLVMRSCSTKTDILRTVENTPSSQGVNPSFEVVKNLQIPLRVQGQADGSHHIQISYNLEIAQPEIAEQVKKDLETAGAWIKDCTIKEIEKLTYDDVRSENIKAGVEKNLLQKINDKLGPRGNVPQIKSVLWTQWDYY